ncbi:hypothetical protein FB451DRAFT_1409602 [Mycena latifolia]|nr:hypothetical protein FB451DRAFT_1409602 [Mycena latifolia]
MLTNQWWTAVSYDVLAYLLKAKQTRWKATAVQAGLLHTRSGKPPPARSTGRRCVRPLTPSFPVLSNVRCAETLHVPDNFSLNTTSYTILNSRRGTLCMTRPRGGGPAPPGSSRASPVHTPNIEPVRS